LKQLQAYRERPEQEYGDVIENVKGTCRAIKEMLQKKGVQGFRSPAAIQGDYVSKHHGF
jgi:hypothetical protein